MEKHNPVYLVTFDQPPDSGHLAGERVSMTKKSTGAEQFLKGAPCIRYPPQNRVAVNIVEHQFSRIFGREIPVPDAGCRDANMRIKEQDLIDRESQVLVLSVFLLYCCIR